MNHFYHIFRSYIYDYKFEIFLKLIKIIYKKWHMQFIFPISSLCYCCFLNHFFDIEEKH